LTGADLATCDLELALSGLDAAVQRVQIDGE